MGADGAVTVGPDGVSLVRLATDLVSLARRGNHRHLLVLAGSPGWTLDAAREATAALDGAQCWLTTRAAMPRLPPERGEALLGTELDVLVVDAHAGLDPDSLGAAAGALRGGGLLLLLTPPLADWPGSPDPQAARIAVHPYTASDLSGRYLRRLARMLAAGEEALVLREGQDLPRLCTYAVVKPPAATAVLGHGCRTADQQAAVEAILGVARGRARRPLVITADRGRGKSAALGIAAGVLLASGADPCRVLVTAPRRLAVEPLFRHAALTASSNGTGPSFLPPDALCQTLPPADLLLVDEAAGVPTPLLVQLLTHYGRVVLATTVHGYEGTGRGFAVRLCAELDRLAPGWRALRLEAPVRWAAEDPLEALVNRALLLDAAVAADTAVAAAQPAICTFERLDRDALADDEAGLGELFGLLVLAHYQTRPMDLRHLLDGPNVQVYAARHRGRVVATALVAMEGRLDADLAAAVFAGRRRPRGHLLPQTLAAHGGLPDAPLLGFARVIRIAVHPVARRRGLARGLIDQVVADARAAGLDLVGASFGATGDLLDFWGCCGLTPVHLGTSRNAASGAHAVVVLRPLSPAGEGACQRARADLPSRLIPQLAGPLRGLAPGLAAALLRGTVPPPDAAPLGALDRQELGAFAHTQRPFEPCLPALTRLAARRIGTALACDLLPAAERDAWIAAVLQRRDWSEIARLGAVAGRAEAIGLLRRATGRLLAGGRGGHDGE